eukprot:TRINITY_DN9969_c0_g1_i3.p1 TRINITY_DN9969_c0_g1~~TRINITY_DN9969_c0_g1_i3.p1  ORF type:complete len:905 (-),score=302.40 TRINITY_DN9969_c0_g1_i3:78-2792(-)
MCIRDRDKYDTDSNVRHHHEMTQEKLHELVSGGAESDSTLKQLLGSTTVYGNAVLTHCLSPLEIRIGGKVRALLDDHGGVDGLVDLLLPCLQQADALVVETAGVVSKGYITLKPNKHAKSGAAATIYDEFLPYLYKQYEDVPHEQFGSFGAAIDEFFARIEAQKIEAQRYQQQADAISRVDKVKAAQNKQLSQLEGVAHLNERKATLIELNHELVDNAILVVTSYLAQGISWEQLWGLIQDEQSRGNPLAQVIQKVNFADNEIQLMLEEPYADSDEEDEGPLLVDIDISMTSFSNARNKYINRKGADAKKEKTLLATEKGIKSAEAKAAAMLKKDKITAHITSIRKVYWFEKFLWFVSSEGYLVIAGHDAQQNEMVVKRHLEPSDVYVHGDLHGAASCVIKNPSGEPIPPVTLEQAGQMAICRSAAWSSKVVTSAWWVYPEQVSKTAPSGEYLTTGSFMIRGKKNYLPPSRLELGFGLLFSLDESSVANHADDYKIRGTDEDAPKQLTAREARLVAEAEEEEINVASCVGSTAELQAEDQEGEEPEDEAQDEEEATEIGAEAEAEVEAPPAAGESNGSRYGDATLAAVDPSLRHEVLKEIEIAEAPKPKREGSKRMSKKERELVKKGLSPEEIEQYLADAARRAVGIKKAAADAPVKVAQQPKIPDPVRGKRGQKKKLKDKYADQDEEEREIRMELLGHKAKPAKKQPVPKREESAVKATPAEENCVKEAAAPGEEWSMENREGWVEEDGVWRRLTPAEKRAIRDKESAEVRMLLEEEGVTVLSKEEADKLSADQIKFLTAVPTAEDKINFAMAVCAPYSAVQKYKYKVKVTPGTQKRGKATKQALALFAGQVDGTTVERDLMKIVPDQEAIAVMVSDAKVSAAGLENAKKNAKKNAKARKQRA